MDLRRLAPLLGVLASATLLGGCAGVQVKPVEIREDSTAISNLSVVSAENLYIFNKPTLIDDKNLVYSAKHLAGGQFSAEVSVWKSPTVGGPAVKLIPAGDGEHLSLAASSPSVANVYFNLGCSNYSTQKSGLGGRRKLTGSGSCDFALVPFADESKVLFSSCVWGQSCYRSDSNYIWVVNADGTNMTQLRQGRAPALSPDGKKIAFSYKGDIWVMNADGGDVTNLTASEDFMSNEPNFSPDGKYIVFQRVKVKNVPESERQNDIWMMRIDGTDLTQLTISQANDIGPYYGGDGFLYFMSNRGPLVAGARQNRIWRAKIVGNKGVVGAR